MVTVGFVSVLFVNVLVDETVGTTTPSTANVPAALRLNVVSLACPSSIEPTPNAVVVEAVIPDTGKLVQLVSVPELGVPSTGVVNVGEVKDLLVKAWAAAKVTTVPLADGNVITVLSVPDSVNVLVTVSVFPAVTETLLPPAAAALVQVVPLEVNTLPEAPGAESPVPPFAAGKTPVTSADKETDPSLI